MNWLKPIAFGLCFGLAVEKDRPHWAAEYVVPPNPFQLPLMMQTTTTTTAAFVMMNGSIKFG